ncbi:HTH-type transcriptional repressor AseR [Anatilimnocola aggregata]|uniref:HTH-type transcriptional repressor AseR n=1 Tax=Anatilimnocola aggregata TaxID=2528021 RepID=A0A517YMH6_9BACT|nr:metalloregulator ArsR/SmtB family transcription factor [Anatilimnocola aggregata]QDU31422.1 HTH-type transcriptional repressor AseR [Anatilimnocola aggregata]
MKTTTLKPDRVFRALSDKTRLRILSLLLVGELCVCDIVSALGCPQPTVSRHLAYLRKAGLVTVRKDGIWCYYQLALAADGFDAALKSCIVSCGSIPRLAKDAERLKQSRFKCCE